MGLRSLNMFSTCDEARLRKIREITYVRKFKQDQYIFRDGQYADFLFALTEGRVSLEISINSGAPYRMKDVYPGRVFGISSIVDTENRKYIANARALQDCKTFCWNSSALEKLFYADYELGFKVMRGVGKILKERLENKRMQLVLEAKIRPPDNPIWRQVSGLFPSWSINPRWFFSTLGNPGLIVGGKGRLKI